MSILKERSDDLVQSVTRFGSDLSTLSTIPSKIDQCATTLAAVSSQLASQNVLVVDALKVC